MIQNHASTCALNREGPFDESECTCGAFAGSAQRQDSFPQWNERRPSHPTGELWSVAVHPNGVVHLKFRDANIVLRPGDLYLTS